VIDAIRHSGELDEALWASLVTRRNGIDILPSSERPEAGHLDPYPVQQVLEYARSVYEYVVVDLVSVCDPVAMAALSSADRIHLVCTPDMSALFLMRRTIPLLEEMGFTREQIRVVVNRYLKRSELSVADMEKIFRWPVERTFDYEPDALRQATREGVPVAENSDLGKSIGKLVQGIAGSASADSAKTGGVGVLKELLSGI
jgi:pilus assembly protein CpaE